MSVGEGDRGGELQSPQADCGQAECVEKFQPAKYSMFSYDGTVFTAGRQGI